MSNTNPNTQAQDSNSATVQPEGKSSSEQQKQDNALNKLRLAPGDYVFKEGDEGEYGYIIESGTIEVGKMSGGKFVKLTDLHEGALFGEMILIDKSPRSASARAVTDTVVKEIDEKAFMAYIMTNPQTAINMMQRLSSYVRSSNQALEVSVFDIPADEQDQSTASTDLKGLSKEDKKTIHEFQSPIKEIETENVPPLVKTTFLSLLLFFLIAVTWASFSIIDTTVSTRGRLTTTMPKINVQSPDNSVIKAIHVDVGQKVKKGELLAELDPTITTADYNMLMARIKSTEGLIERLEAEKGQLGLKALPSISQSMQREIYTLRLSEFQSKIANHNYSILKAKNDHQQAKINFNIAKLDVDSAYHELRKVQHLVKEKILHEIGLREAEIKVKKAEAKFKNAKANLKNTVSQHSVKMEEKNAFISNWTANIHKELAAATEKVNRDREEMSKMEKRMGNTSIHAPETGIILELEDLFVGSIVNAGQSVMALVPTEAPLTVEMDIDPKEISNIKMDDRVSLKLDALPFQKHGSMEGKIVFLSEDTIDEGINGKPGTFYRARAEIVSRNLKEVPDNFRLIPGMQLSSDIKVGKRRLITYFIYPIIRTIETSFREP